MHPLYFMHILNFVIFRTDSEKHVETMGKAMKKFHAGKSSSMVKKKDFVKQMNSGSKYGVSVITDVTSGDLNAFGSYEVNVVVTSLTWGEYRDKLIIEIDEMEPIIVDLIIHSKSAPITWATKSVMFGGVPASSKANKKMPLINVGMVLYRLGRRPDMLTDYERPRTVRWTVVEVLIIESVHLKPFGRSV